MKKIALLTSSVCICFFVLFYISCKKSKNSTPATTPVTFTPAAVTRVAGEIRPSTVYLKLHVGNSASASAILYNGDGTQATTAPSFSWTVDNSSVLTVTNGSISAIGLGDAQITISDGVHASGYVHVSVLADTVSIPSGPANIVFNGACVGVQVGASTAVPAYTITDFSGAVVSAVPSFEIEEANSGIAISGSNLTASGKGFFHLQAKYNGAYLNGGLPVAAFSAAITQPDTLTSFYIIGDFPAHFYRYGVTAKPIKIHVTQVFLSPGVSGFILTCFDTSPDKITIDYPDVLTATPDGLLKSVSPGVSSMTISFAAAKGVFFTDVNVDMTGSWGGSLNGTSYNFCFPPPAYLISYGASYSGGTSPSGIPDFSGANAGDQSWGSAFVGVTNGTAVYDQFYYASRPVPTLGLISGNTLTGQIWSDNSVTHAAVDGSGYRLYWLNDINKIKMVIDESGASVVTLVNGNGNCSGGTTTSTLDYILCNGSSRSWTGDACFNDVEGNWIYTFHSDHTLWISPVDSLYIPVSWSATNDQIIITTREYDAAEPNGFQCSETLFVHSYTNTQVTINSPLFEIDCGDSVMAACVGHFNAQ